MAGVSRLETHDVECVAAQAERLSAADTGRLREVLGR